MTVAEKVLTMLADVAEVDEVRKDLDLRLYDLHILDSLGTVGLMAALSLEFGVEISPAEFDPQEWATPRKIVSYMENRVGR